jgi:hypothetical protein
MPKSHTIWNSFVPSTSRVDNFFGGIKGLLTEDQFRNYDPGVFCGITYRLRVTGAQNGWHHFLGMWTSIQGVAWSNACVKESCRAGDYQFNFHFHRPRPTNESVTDAYEHNSYKYSMFYGQDQAAAANYYGHNKAWNSDGGNGATPTWVDSNQYMDIMVFRPTLVDPADANNYVQLWDASDYDGWQMYFTGFPLADPNLIDQSTYEIT